MKEVLLFVIYRLGEQRQRSHPLKWQEALGDPGLSDLNTVESDLNHSLQILLQE